MYEQELDSRPRVNLDIGARENRDKTIWWFIGFAIVQRIIAALLNNVGNLSSTVAGILTVVSLIIGFGLCIRACYFLGSI